MTRSTQPLSALLSSIPGVVHAFGNRAEPVPRPLQALWDQRPGWKQVHGVGVADVRRLKEECGDVDALFTFAPGIPISVQTADCVPVLFARKDGKAVAAVHAGWRGTRARIVEATWKALAARGERASGWVAAIGPSIGACCYQVSEEIAKDFLNEFGGPAGLGSQDICPSHRMLDLWSINEHQLRSIGIAKIDSLRICTRCSTDASGAPLYHSFRREGGGTRQWSGVMIV